MRIKNKNILAFFVILTTLFFSCLAQGQEIDYTKKENWAYFNEITSILQTKSTEQTIINQSLSKSPLESLLGADTLQTADTLPAIDVFFIAPTVYAGAENAPFMSMHDADSKANFLGATNMEKGIYDHNARFFAPYYRQIGLSVYKKAQEEQEQYLEKAYADIRNAFLYYMEQENNGRPFILAGFSQGADMCIRLLKEFFHNVEYQELLIACYAIGWRLTEEDVKHYPHLMPAKKADDIGVIISFNSEAKHITHSLMVAEDAKTYAINPLTWTTSNSEISKNANKGACFTDYSGAIISEIPALTGAYIDKKRGTLKVLDIEEKDYPAYLDIFEEGVFHIYDYLFFYRNLQENVMVRCNAYFHGLAKSSITD